MKNIFLLPLLVVLVAGCDRLSKDNAAKIQIQMPPQLSKVSSSAVAGTMPVPDGLSDVAGVNTPINCYLVGVNGPEADLSRNTCNRKDGTREFKIGQWAGGIAPGGAVTLDVPSGKNRNFYVIGFHAVGTSCKDFKAGFPEHDLISNPYIIGKVENVTLNAGETKDLPVQVAFDSDGWFEDCKGPDFPDNGGGGGNSTIVPTKIKLSKDYFPYNNFVQYSCQSVNVSLVDDQGRTGSLPHSVSFSLNTLAGSFQVFPTMEACNAYTPTLTQFTLPANSYHGSFAVKPNAGSSISFEASSIISATALTTTALTAPVVASTDSALEIDSPHSMLAGLCYPIKVNHKLTNNTFWNAPSNVLVTATTSGVSLYSDSGCNTAISSFTIATGTDNKQVYLKAASVTTSQVSVSLASSGYLTSDRKIWIGSGNATPYAMQIDGDNKMQNTGCFENPYRVVLLNSNHTPIVATANTPFSLTTDTANLTLHGDSDCTVAMGLSIPSGQYYTNFYLKNENVNGLGTRTISVTPTSLNPSSYTVNIDGAYRIEAMASSANIASGACVAITADVKSFTNQLLSNAYRDLSFRFTNALLSVERFTDPGCTASAGVLSTGTPSPATSNGGVQMSFYMKVTNLSAGAQAFQPIVTDETSSVAPLNQGTVTVTVNPP